MASVVWCQVEVSAYANHLSQGVLLSVVCRSECDLETITRRRPRATRLVKPCKKKKVTSFFNNIHSKDHPFSWLSDARCVCGLFFFWTFIGLCIVIYSYGTPNKTHLFLKLFILVKMLYMFRTVFLSIIRSSKLHIWQQAYSRYRQLFDICLLLYVQFWAPDDGQKDCPKCVEHFTRINNLRNRCILLVVLQECLWLLNFHA